MILEEFALRSAQDHQMLRFQKVLSQVVRLQEGYWYKAILERLAMKLGCTASWKDECLFRRPQEEDRRSRREGDAQDRGRPRLRGGRLLGQALLGDLSREEIPCSEEAPRLRTEARRRREEAFGGEPRGAPGGDPAPEARVLAAGMRGFGQRLDGF